jgi:integrase
MGSACKLAGLIGYTPHDLRHRRISLWVRTEPIADVAAWVGHSKKSMTLDVYSHVMLAGEIEPVRLFAVLGCAGDGTVVAGDALADHTALT